MKENLVLIALCLLIGCTSGEKDPSAAHILDAKSEKVVIQFDPREIYIGIPNFFKIVAIQEQPLPIKEISAILKPANGEKPYKVAITNNHRRFSFKVNDPGKIEISINTKYGLIKKERSVRRLPIELYMSKYSAGSSNLIGVNEFRVQKQIDAVIICCNINARCSIKGFELVRAPRSGRVEKVVNEGSQFGMEAIQLIKKCQPGDLYVFRKITYKCPGDSHPQYSNDMTVEIK